MSEHVCSLYLLDEPQILAFLVNGTLNSTKNEGYGKWTNMTYYSTTIDFHLLTDTSPTGWGLPIENSTNEETGDVTRDTRFFVLIINEVNETNSFSFRFRYENELLAFIDEIFRHTIFAVFFIFGGALFLDAWREKKTGTPVKAHIFKNYAIGFMFGGGLTLAWEIYHWYKKLHPQESWEKLFTSFDMPEAIQISNNILTFGTFLSLGFSIAFMSNTVEKNIHLRRMPILTYLLIISEVLLIIFGIVYIEALVILFFVWIPILVLAILNIMLAYIKVARISSGDLKKKSIYIIISFIVTFSLIGLRDFIRPEFISNGVGTLFVYFLYRSVKM